MLKSGRQNGSQWAQNVSRNGAEMEAAIPSQSLWTRGATNYFSMACQTGWSHLKCVVTEKRRTHFNEPANGSSQIWKWCHTFKTAKSEFRNPIWVLFWKPTFENGIKIMATGFPVIEPNLEPPNLNGTKNYARSRIAPKRTPTGTKNGINLTNWSRKNPEIESHSRYHPNDVPQQAPR